MNFDAALLLIEAFISMSRKYYYSKTTIVYIEILRLKEFRELCINNN